MDMNFRAAHPFVIADGRRFASLYCAAQSVTLTMDMMERARLLPVIDEQTGTVHDLKSCLGACRGPLPGTVRSMSREYAQKSL